jgi:colicin import membrane protein
MPRKLKTYQTSLGFYDLAISAPSMKAALDAWGAGSNLFHQGAAKETDDPDVVAATMAQPGVVLRRPAGSSGRFAEHSDLPTSEEVEHPRTSRSKAKRSAGPQISKRAASRAAVDFERERKQRDAARRRELAEEAKKRERRDRASPKRKLLSTKPSANMMSEQATSKRSVTPSRRGLKTRRLVGRERRGS